MAEREGVPQAVAQFLTTEHFALQTAKTTTTTEINGRMQSYLSLLSAVILALAFIAQLTEMSSTFYGFALVLLPLVYFLGVATMERVDQIWNEWMLYQMGMNRIRHFYLEVAPELERYFVLPTADDRTSTLAPTGVERSRWNWMTGISGMIAAVNSLVAGVLAGLTAYQAGAPAALAWPAGVVGFAASLALLRTMELRSRRRHQASFKSEFPAEESERSAPS